MSGPTLAPLHQDLLGQKGDLAVEQQKSGQVEPLDQAELLGQATLHLCGNALVPPNGPLPAELFQVAQRRAARGHRRVGQAVAQVGAEVEAALLGHAQGVGHRLGALGEEALHLRGRLQVQMVVGPQMGQGLVDGGIEPGGQPAPAGAGRARGAW